MSNPPAVTANPEVSASARNSVLLLAAAAVLIANSHLERYYPPGFAWMAADGLLGNSIFFFLSGFGIAKTLTGRPQSFGDFYWRRILRIYPTVWVVELCFRFFLMGFWRDAGWRDYVRFLIYPTSYGYVEQIMIYYVLLYFMKLWLRSDHCKKMILALFVPLLGFYGYELWHQPQTFLSLGLVNTPLWYVFDFQIVLCGCVFALQAEAPPVDVPGTLAKLAAVFVAYVAVKFAMVKGWMIPGLHLPWARLFLLLHLLVFPIVCLAYSFGTAKVVIERLQKSTAAFWLVGLIGGLTLEVYIVHWFVLENERVSGIRFPLNIAVFFAITIVLSWLVSHAARVLRLKLGRLVEFAGRPSVRPAMDK